MSEHADGTVYGKYIKIKSGPSGVKNCSRYILDPEKTWTFPDARDQEIPYARNALIYIGNDPKVTSPSTGQRLVPGHNCCPDTAAREFSLAEKLYNTYKNENLAPGQKANQAFHIVLSYKGTSVSPEMVHKMGCEFARRLCGDEFQAVTATHLNTANYHNHILVNAYALDGKHKFRDSYRRYRQFRGIANEISLEYGLPVFVNDGHGPEQTYKSWKEFTATREGESWKEAITMDLDRAICAASSYQEVLAAMQELGYEIQYNPRSVTFKKGKGRVRDSRLGYSYTRDGIQGRLDQKRKKKNLELHMEETMETRRKRAARPYQNIHISRYDQYGRRRSSLMRFLLMLKKTVLLAMEEETSRLTSGPHAGGSPSYIPAPTPPGRRLEYLDEAIRTADHYGITSPAVLEMKIRELHAQNASCRRIISSLENFLENAGEIKQLVAEYRKLELFIRSAGLPPEALVSIPDPATIRENLARMDPVTPRTRSRLFQAIHNSPYTLTRKFCTLTETDAHRILTAIREQRRENLPDGLVLWGRERSPSAGKEAFPSRNAALPPDRQKPVALKEYSPESRQAILDFKAAADRLASYGLTDQAAMDQFLQDMEKRITELDRQKAVSEENRTELRALFRLKNQIRQSDPSILAPGPALSGDNAQNGSLAGAAIWDSSRYDTLAYMNTRLQQLPKFTRSELVSMTIPDPGEYRFLHDLQALCPDRKVPGPMSPENVHNLLAKLKSEDFFEMEMKKELEKELEKERKEVRNGKDNTL